MSSPIVFFDIAGPDEPALRTFYATVFGWDCEGPAPFQPGHHQRLGAHIRQDPKEVLLYIGVPDVADTLRTIEAMGGQIHRPRFEVSGVAVIGLFFDPAGNKLGLIEMDGEDVKIP